MYGADRQNKRKGNVEAWGAEFMPYLQWKQSLQESDAVRPRRVAWLEHEYSLQHLAELLGQNKQCGNAARSGKRPLRRCA